MALAAAAQSSAPVPLIVLPAGMAQSPDPARGYVASGLPIVRATYVVTSRDRARTNWAQARLRLRSRTVADLYPIDGSGLRLSGGARLQSGYAQAAATPDVPLAFSNDPWRSSGPGTLRGGYRSFAPVAQIGYSEKIGEHWRMGVDAGAMRGRLESIYPFDGSAGRASAPRADGFDRINPVVDATLAFAF